MLILGFGIIGLEMGTVYSSLGARMDVVEMMDGLMQGADHDLVKIWQKISAKRFDNIMLKTKTISARVLPEGIEVPFAATEEGSTAPAPQVYELVLQAVGPHAQRQNNRRRQGGRCRRCGMTATRSWARVPSVLAARQIGTWPHNPFQTSRWSSASIGDPVKRRFRRLR